MRTVNLTITVSFLLSLLVGHVLADLPERPSLLPFIQDSLGKLWAHQSARLGGVNGGVPFITVSQSPTHPWTSIGNFMPAENAYALVPVPARDLEDQPHRVDFDIWPLFESLTRLTGDPAYRETVERMAAAFTAVGFDAPSGLLRIGAGMFDFDVVTTSPSPGGPWGEPAYKPGDRLDWELLWNTSPEQVARFMKATYFGLVTRPDDMRFNRYVSLGFNSRERQLVQAFNPAHRGFLLSGAILVRFWSMHHLRTGDPETLAWANKMTEMWEATRNPRTGLLPHFIGAIDPAEQDQPPTPYANSSDSSSALIFLQTARDLAGQPETASLAARLHDLGLGLIRGLAEHAYDRQDRIFHVWLNLDGGVYTGESFYTFRTQSAKDAALERDPRVAVVEVHAGDGFFHGSKRSWTCGTSLPLHIAQAAAITGDRDLAAHAKRLAGAMLEEARGLPPVFNSDGQWTFPAIGGYIQMLLNLSRATGDTGWLDAADELAQRSIGELNGLSANKQPAWWRLPWRSGFLNALADLETERRVPEASIKIEPNLAVTIFPGVTPLATPATGEPLPETGNGMATLGAVRVVRLNPDQPLTPGSAQYAWAETALHLPFAGWTVVLYEESLLSVSPHRGYNERSIDLLAPLMEKWRVDLVVFKSTGEYLRARPFSFKAAGSPVTYLGLGENGQIDTQNALRPAAWVATRSGDVGYLLAKATASELRIQALKPDGSTIETLHLTRERDVVPGRPWTDLVAENHRLTPPLPILPTTIWDNLKVITLDPQTTGLTAAFDDPTGNHLRFRLQWNLPTDCAWTISPEEIVLGATADGPATTTFAITPPTAESFYPLPSLEAGISFDGHPVQRRKIFIQGLNRPAITVPSTRTPPLLDGNLNQTAWNQAGITSLKWQAGGKGISRQETIVRLTYDGQALYIAFECFDSDPSQAYRRATPETADDAWQDDCIEVFIDAAFDRVNARQFITTIGGITLDTAIAHRQGRTRWIGFDGAWQQTVREDPDRWIVQKHIPWSDLGLQSAPEPGTRMGLNLVRLKRVPASAADQDPDFDYSQWAVTIGGNTTVEHFGTLVLGPLNR